MSVTATEYDDIINTGRGDLGFFEQEDYLNIRIGLI
jgi:hypothetical protein